MYHTAQGIKVFFLVKQGIKVSPSQQELDRHRDNSRGFFCDEIEIKTRREWSREPINEIVHVAASWRRRHILHHFLLPLWIVYSRSFMWNPTTPRRRRRLSGYRESSHRLHLLPNAGAIRLRRLSHYVMRRTFLVDRFPKHRPIICIYIVACLNNIHSINNHQFYDIFIINMAYNLSRLTWRTWCSWFVHHETRRWKSPFTNLSYNNVWIVGYTYTICVYRESCIYIYTSQNGNGI